MAAAPGGCPQAGLVDLESSLRLLAAVQSQQHQDASTDGCSGGGGSVQLNYDADLGAAAVAETPGSVIGPQLNGSVPLVVETPEPSASDPISICQVIFASGTSHRRRAVFVLNVEHKQKAASSGALYPGGTASPPKLSNTCAGLGGADRVELHHLLEAIIDQFRYS